MDTSTDSKKKDALAAGTAEAHATTSAKKAATDMSRPSKDRPLIKLSINLIHTYKHINEVCMLAFNF